MNDEERNELVKKSFENVLKKLANNPEELMDNHKLQIKYNNVLKEKIKLQSNWNSLREWVQSEYNRYLNDTENLIHSNVEVIDFSRMLDKMNELESGNKE